MLRSDRPLNQSIKDKISLMCDVDAEGVVNCVDAPSIYDVPKILFEEGLDAYVVRELGLPFHDVDWDEWADLLERVHHPKHEVNIAIVGKYIDLPDAYLSVTEPSSRRLCQLGQGQRQVGCGRSLRNHRRCGRRSRQRRRHRDPRRLRHPRHRRQDRRSEVRP